MQFKSNNHISEPLSLEQAQNKEWIITNGLGGYASTTICGLNRRKYHGLLVAAMTPPTNRRVFLTKIEEVVTVGEHDYNLSIVQYKENLQSGGFGHYKLYKHKPFPKLTFNITEATLTKELVMPQGENSVYLRYKNIGDTPLRLKLRPFLTDRDFHSLMREKNLAYDIVEREQGGYSFENIKTENTVHCDFSKGTFEKEALFFYNTEYLIEKDRGHEYAETNFVPGYIDVTLLPDEKIDLAFSLEKNFRFRSYKSVKSVERNRQKALRCESYDDFLNDLIVSSDQFIVDRHSIDSKSLIAGYHWFSDWGRDSMIALRGQAIPLGKQALTRDIISTFLHYLDEGMIPNRFPDNDEPPVYNTIDATLWLFVTLYEYDEVFSDKIFVQSIITKLRSIILYHKHGTRYNIHQTEEGFIFAGDAQTQLTWMDAIFDKHAFTPRWSCAVEINALWYNALNVYNYFIEKYELGNNEFQEDIKLLEDNFTDHFFNGRYLNDLVNPGVWTDKAIRPNQIYAVSLPFSLLTEEQSIQVVDVVKEHLFTPFGLRTLSPSHADYKDFYGGGQWHRDAAYHQGTAWPFLLGEFYHAYLKVEKFSAEAVQFVEESIEPLKEHFYFENGLHSISEIFDGNYAGVSRGKGCIQQAWSVSQMIKVLLEIKRNRAK